MKQPKFTPNPGQVDFTNIRWAPVINCVLEHDGNYLVIRRSESLQLYPGYWNGISGFLDDEKSLKEKVYEELREEVGISKKNVRSIYLGSIFDQDSPRYKKTWIVHPVLVRVKTDRVRLDWEGAEYRWLSIKEIEKLKLLPGFKDVLRALELTSKK